LLVKDYFLLAWFCFGRAMSCPCKSGYYSDHVLSCQGPFGNYIIPHLEYIQTSCEEYIHRPTDWPLEASIRNAEYST